MSQPDATLAALDHHSLLLTPNLRLSRTLLNRHAQLQRERGVKAWRRPAILPFSGWLQQLYLQQQALSSDRRWQATLLDEWAQRLLWQQAVESALPDQGLFRAADLAVQASDAWELLQLWQVSESRLINELAVDESFGWLAQWVAHFRGRCREQGWISSAELPALITTAIDHGQISLPRQLLLYAFDEWPPAWQRLLDRANAAGATLRQLDADPRPSQPQRLPCDQERDELQAIAAWCRRVLIERGERVRIGVVAPELPRVRGQLLHALREQLEPHALLPSTPPYTPPVNLSAPLPLPAVPIIADALTLLRLTTGTDLSATALRQILRSPFIGEERRQAQFEAALQQQRRHEWSPPLLRAALLQLPNSHASPFSSTLIDLLDQAQQGSAAQPPSYWARRFSSALLALGWPGERTLDSEELQAVETWREALQRFAMLDPYTAPLAAGTALQRLTELLALASFQPQSGDSPIQILGLLEASGLQFDQLWIMGLDRGNWPTAPAPNPLLPIGLQRRLDLPRATAEREIEFAARITRRLLGAADQVILSHACRKDEEPLEPSPLISGWPTTTAAALGLVTSAIEPLRQQPLATLPTEDHQGLPLVLTDDRPSRGGTQLLKDQAACPFRAYANHRLRLLPAEPPQLGFDARERGTFSHLLMERFWSEVRSQERLQHADAAQRDAWCQQAVDAVMQQQHHRTAGAGRLWQIERQRLLRLLQTALLLDLQRPPFTVTVEQPAALSIGPLRLRTRADRIDRLEDGSLLLIDYKGSEHNVTEWLGERPDEPQLPLYLLQQDDRQPIAAIAFFMLDTERSKLAGLGAHDDLAPGIKLPRHDEMATDPWNTQIDLWQQHLTRLAEEFAAGIARVTPKRLPHSCEYCPHRPLCRIDDHG